MCISSIYVKFLTKVSHINYFCLSEISRSQKTLKTPKRQYSLKALISYGAGLYYVRFLCQDHCGLFTWGAERNRGGRVLMQDCCLMAKGQCLCPALANPRGLCLCAPVSSWRGAVVRVSQSGSGPGHNTMARGNYARQGMGNGGGRDIWTLTSNPGSLHSHNTTARLERAAV